MGTHIGQTPDTSSSTLGKLQLSDDINNLQMGNISNWEWAQSPTRRDNLIGKLTISNFNTFQLEILSISN